MDKPTESPFEAADRTEEFLDRRFREKLPGLVLELQDKIDARFERQRDRRNRFLTLTGAVAATAIGFFGFKTYQEIHGVVVTVAKEEAKAQFVAPETRREVSSIMKRALLDSYLTTLARREATQEEADMLPIQDIDVEQLLEMLVDKHITPVEFKGVVKVLISVLENPQGRVEREAASERIVATLASSLVNNRESKNSISLLVQLSNNHVRGPAISIVCRDLILGKHQADHWLRWAAIFYAGETVDNDAMEGLVKIAEDKREPLRDIATLSIAKIDPESDIVARWVDDYTKKKKASETWTALRMVLVLWKAKVDRLPVALLEFSVEKGITFRVINNRLYADEPGEDKSTNANELPLELIKSVGLEEESVVERLLWSYAQTNNLKAICKLLNALPIRPLSSGGVPPFTVNISSTDTAGVALKVEGGRVVRVGRDQYVGLSFTESEAIGGQQAKPLVLIFRNSVNGQLEKVTGIERAVNSKFRVLASPEWSSSYPYSDYTIETEECCPDRVESPK